MTDGLPEPSLADLDASTLPALLEPAGALHVRDAGVRSPAGLAELAESLGLVACRQREPFTARRALGRDVWSGATWPRTEPMCMHHELGWQRTPPPYLLIACLRPPVRGGRTGIADGRAVLPRIPSRVLGRGREHGWTLVRRYGPGPLCMRWQDAFPGEDAAAVEAYAAAERIELAWHGRQRLVTRRVRPVVRATGLGRRPAWSNLLAFCSAWTLAPGVRDYLVSTLGRDALPFETSFGDGTPLSEGDVSAINAVYDELTTWVERTTGDVLIIDNVRVAHSTEPYDGEREMAVVHASAARG